MNDLFSNLNAPGSADHFGRGVSANMQVVRLALSLDHRAWLDWLADEWWPLGGDRTDQWLGVGRPVDIPLTEGRTKVTAWIDPRRLPNVEIQVYRAGQWSLTSAHRLDLRDEQIIWSAPIPLEAVDSFTVESPAEAKRIVAMAKGFANIELPAQDIGVDVVESRSKESLTNTTTLRRHPPEHWDAMRGAASMALWAVPPIDPWLDTFCASLAVTPPRAEMIDLRVPWWHSPVWRDTHVKDISIPPLWLAMIEVLRTAKVKEWRPRELFDRVMKRALDLGADRNVVDRLTVHTHAILEDRQVISPSLEHSDPLGFVLQLVLLRPAPDRFALWREDLPGLSPSVWWTGAMLIGFITGYRNLAPQYRGSREARKALAWRTWQLSGGFAGDKSTWFPAMDAVPRWTSSGEKVDIWCDDELWAERPGSTRGRWFRANYEDEDVRAQAIEVARKFYPAAVRQSLQLSSGALSYSGPGEMRVEAGRRELLIDGTINLALHLPVALVDELDVPRFKDWLANGGITERLPRPPMPVSLLNEFKEAANGLLDDGHQHQASLQGDPPGLSVVREFITPEQEETLLTSVDQSPWLDELSRRVQHYGWKYDYKTKKVKKQAYLGPLPEWAQALAKRLVDSGLIETMPDQVIVNEYVKNQGISKHIDCPDCFVGSIVTISLNESWGMVFRGPTEEKFELVLPRRSAVVLDGEVRTKWTHEIPKKLKEAGKIRGRRVSLTFRKVRL